MTDNRCPQCGADRWTVDENAPYCENSWHREQDHPSPLQSVITWIPVNERLPEERRSILFVTGAESRPCHGYRQGDTWYWCFGWNTSTKHVTHWAELPEPPKE